jgi:hypothetical protein
MGVGKHICTSVLCSFFDPPEGEDALLVSDAGALDHDEVLLDLSVVGETAHGVDGLVSQVVPKNHFSLHNINRSVVNFIYTYVIKIKIKFVNINVHTAVRY